MSLRDGHLLIETEAGVGDTVSSVDIDLSAFAARQVSETLVGPWIDFTNGGRNFRLAVESASFVRETGEGRVVQSVTIDRGENNAGPVVLSSMEAQLFSDRP